MVCGAESTEPAYFHGLKRYLRNPAVHVKVKEKNRAPNGLVKYARKIATESEDEFDEVWCVVDSDQFDLEPVEALAKKRHVWLAVSNPCFELWLLLHHQDWKAFLCDEEVAKRQLRKHVPGYKKNDLQFAHFEAGVTDALGRAKRLAPTGQNYRFNPSSGVWELVQLMMEGGQRP